MMPQLGETVTEGTITRWMKAVGDTIARDEPLFEVSTDKVDSEVPSPAAGVLTEILVPEGETVEVGVKLAVIGDGAGSSGAAGSRAAARAERRDAVRTCQVRARAATGRSCACARAATCAVRRLHALPPAAPPPPRSTSRPSPHRAHRRHRPRSGLLLLLRRRH